MSCNNASKDSGHDIRFAGLHVPADGGTGLCDGSQFDILLELFCCDYWRIDDDRAVAKRRGGSCARFADNPYKLTCNPRK